MKEFNIFTIAIIFFLIIISFFVEIKSPTGLAVGEVNDIIESEVEKALDEKDKAKVIIILKDKEDNFFMDGKEADISEIKRDLSENEFTEGHDFEEIGAFSGEITEMALNKLKNNANVDKIQLDHVFTVLLQDSVPLIRANRIHDKVLLNNLTGKNQAVCVLDTGINYSHSDLFDNYVGGYDYVNEDNDPLDDHGHGTHVSGIAAGVAPNVKIIHMKVLNNLGSGLESDIIAAINWCIANKTNYNISVISMSLGAGLYNSYCDTSFPALASAINGAVNAGISVVAASGNNFSPTHINAPACIQNTIGVGATDKNNNIAGYSNRNAILDLLAPGSNINSTSMNGGYEIISGTSMSTPHVAASVVLMQQFEYEEARQEITPAQVENLLKNNGLLIDSWKRIDVFHSVASLDDTIPNLTVDAPQNVTYYKKKVDLNFSASDVFLDKVVYRINNGNENNLSGNITLDLDGGNYNLLVNVNDSNGNRKFTIRNFTVVWPNVILNSPADNENDLDGNVRFNCSANSQVGLSNLSLYHNASGVWRINKTEVVNSNETNLVFDINFTNNIIFVWTCAAQDLNNNIDFGENRTLRINYNTAPVINYYYPNTTNVSIDEPRNQTFNISYFDGENDNLTVRWFKNSILVDNDRSYDFLGSYSSSGAFNITAQVSDLNLSTSNYWSFVINNIEYCGDGIRNATEQCEGSDFGERTCSSYGYNSGDLICVGCTISISGCTNSSRGGSGGGGGGGGGGRVITSEEQRLLREAQAEREESAPESNVDVEEAVFSGQQNIETSAPAQEIGQTTGLNVKESGSKISGAFWGVIISLIIILLIVFFIRKEWRVIKNK